MCDVFVLITEPNIGNYADDATLFECEANLIDTQNLKVFEWFRNNLKQIAPNLMLY